MTEYEFLTMFNEQLENLEKEKNNILQKIDYLKETNQQGPEFQGTSYRLSLIMDKIELIKKLINLPTYARIQAMSDIEIEEYKKNKIKELDIKVKELKEREKQEKDKEELLQLKMEILEIAAKQEEIIYKRDKEIKKELLSEKVARWQFLYQVIDNASKYSWDSSKRLLASVSSDYEKAPQMARLLASYKMLSDELESVKVKIDLDYSLPEKLKESFYRVLGIANRDSYNLEECNLKDVNEFIDIINRFEEKFKCAKNDFNNQFTEQKVSKLVDNYYTIKISTGNIDSTEVDMQFLNQHSDKIYGNKLEELQELINQKNELVNKSYKTEDVSRKIKSLEEQIKEKQTKIYREIMKWYDSQCEDILGLSGNISDFRLYGEKSFLERSLQEIAKTQQVITKTKETLEVAKTNLERNREKIEQRKTPVVQQIITLTGQDFTEDDIPLLTDDYEVNLKKIKTIAYMVEMHRIIDMVQKEGKKQANIKETELRDMTVEQLSETQRNDEEEKKGKRL